MNYDNDTLLFPEFDSEGGFHSDPAVKPSLREDYLEALNQHLDEFVSGHLQYGGYHASPGHCERYLSEIWEAGEFAMEEHVQTGAIGAMPDEHYDCFNAPRRFGGDKTYSMSYFDQLFRHANSSRGVPLLDAYLVPIKRAHSNAAANLQKFRRLLVEMAAITILLISMMLYGAFFMNWTAKEAAVADGLASTRFFLYLFFLFLLVPILIFFQNAHKDDSGTFRLFYHPAVLTVITLLCLLSAVFGLRIFGVVRGWLTALTFWIPLVFYLVYYALDAIHVYYESRKIKYARAWRREYAKIYEEECEKAMRYVRFRMLWWRMNHKLPVWLTPLWRMQAKCRRYERFYRWCLSASHEAELSEEAAEE